MNNYKEIEKILIKKIRGFIVPYKIGFNELSKKCKGNIYNQIEFDFYTQYSDLFGYNLVIFFDNHNISDFIN